MPCDFEIIDALRRWTLDTEITERHNARNGTMIQVLNLAALFRRVAPLFDARLAGSCFGDWRGTIRIECEVASALLRLDAGRVSVPESGTPDLGVVAPQAALLKMILSSDSFRRMGLDRRLGLDRRSGELLDALFPIGNPVIGFQ